MLDLLKANFSRAFRGARFYVSVGIMLFVAFMDLFMSHRHGYGIDDQFMDGSSFMSLLVPLVAGMFISRDYTNNTIRNKIIVGHSRVNIYLANLITAIAIGFALTLINLIPTLGIGIPLLGWGDADMDKVWICMGMMFLLTVVHAAFVTFMCMTMQGISGTVLSFVAYYVVSLVASIVLAFNSDNELGKLIIDALPDFQFSQLTSVGELPERLNRFPLYSCGLIAVFTGAGLALFHRADIK